MLLWFLLHVAGTQTLLTFPMNFDLYQLLSPGFNYLEEKSAVTTAAAGGGCDPGNSSLRRKLFGQPDRQVIRQPPWIVYIAKYSDLSLSLSRVLFLSPPVSLVREVMMYSLQLNTLQHRPCHLHLYKNT